MRQGRFFITGHKKSKKWFVSIGLFCALSTGLYAWTQSEHFCSLICNFRANAHTDFTVSGPFSIGTNWKSIDLPKTMKAIPHSQYVLLLGDGKTHYAESGPGYWYQWNGKLDDNVRDTPNAEYRELEGSDRFQAIPGGFAKIDGGKAVTFEVKLEDTQGRQVQLIQSTLGRTFEDEQGRSNPFVGLSIYHDRWDKFYFHPNLEVRRIYVKASSPIVLTGIRWSAEQFSLNPCKTWETIDPKKIFNFDQTPPPSTDMPYSEVKRRRDPFTGQLEAVPEKTN